MPGRRGLEPPGKSQLMVVRYLSFCVFAVAALLSASPASAEIVVFTSGRTTTVKAHREQGDQVVLVLAGGGEIVCARSTVDRILPDEMPAFEDAAAQAAANGPALPAAYQEIIEQAAARHGVSA